MSKKTVVSEDGMKPFDLSSLSKAPVAEAVSKALGNDKGNSVKSFEILTDDYEFIDSDGGKHSREDLLKTIEPGMFLSGYCISKEHDDENPSGYVSKLDNGNLFFGCHSCEFKAFSNVSSSTNNPSPDQTVTVTIQEIDKQAIWQNLTIAEKMMMQIIADIVTYIPSLEYEDVEDIESHHIVRNIEINSIYPIGKLSGELMIYYYGYWRKFDSDDLLRHFVKSLIVKSIGHKPAKLRFLIDIIIGELMENYRHPAQFANQICINLMNEVLIIKDGNFTQASHDEANTFLYKLLYDYDPNVETAFIRNFFMESIEEDAAVDVFFEYLGSTFIPTDVLNMEKMLLLVGSGSNGKSVILSLIKATLGIENVSTLELHQLTNDNKLQVTIGKLLNIGSDIDSNRVDASLIKRVASSEPVTVDKKYGASFTIESFPKNIFAANFLPQNTSDTSGGYFRRFLILTFNRVFNHKVKDMEFMPRLLEHKPAILKLILEGASRLLENGEFTYSEKIDKAAKHFERSVDSVRSFIYDCTVEIPEPDSTIQSTKLAILYHHYESYCVQEGLKSHTKGIFKKGLINLGFRETHTGNTRGFNAVIKPPLPQGNTLPDIPQQQFFSTKNNVQNVQNDRSKELP